MANYRPKGVAWMRELARRGGLASGKTRRRQKVARVLRLDPVPAELLDRPSHAGGSHDHDWQCPYCRHANSIKRRACAKCARTPANGRMTKVARRARAAEHRTMAILRKHGTAKGPYARENACLLAGQGERLGPSRRRCHSFCESPGCGYPQGLPPLAGRDRADGD